MPHSMKISSRQSYSTAETIMKAAATSRPDCSPSLCLPEMCGVSGRESFRAHSQDSVLSIDASLAGTRLTACLLLCQLTVRGHWPKLTVATTAETAAATLLLQKCH